MKNSKIQKFKNSKIQKFKNSKIQKFKNSKIQKFKNSKINRFFSLKNQIFATLFSFLLVLGACKNELNEIGKEVQLGEKQIQTANFDLLTSTDEIKVVNGRLVFADYESYKKTIDALAKMNHVQLNDWEKSIDFYSLRRYNSQNLEKQVLAEIPFVHAAILNSKGEYQIGDIISWLHDGHTYFIKGNDERKLKHIQNNPKLELVEKYAYKVKNISTKNPEGITNYAVIPGGGQDARYQYQYNYGGHTYKMVFEVSSYAYWNYIGANLVCSNEIYSSVKLEYRKNNGTWAMAGESATKSVSNGYYSITPDIGNVCCPPTYTSNFSDYINSNQPLHIKLGQTFNWDEALDWNVTVSGNYYENVSIHNKTYSLSPASW